MVKVGANYYIYWFLLFYFTIFYCSCSCLLHLYERFTEGALGAQREASNQTRGVREYFSEKVELNINFEQ